MGRVLETPVIIIGSGIAGLLTALKLSESGLASIVATKTCLTENSSWMAQGGIAAVLPENPLDSIELHVKDTLNAGAGLADETVTRSILSEGHLAIEDLLKIGVPFDRVDGQLTFTREAAHTAQRILHAGGDATGRSIQDTLIQAVKADPLITVFEQCSAIRLRVDEQHCTGVDVVQWVEGEIIPMTVLAEHTVVSTGGIGRLYSHTTNPAIATGDGVALAYQAGAEIQDMEFVQFHPTAFWADGQARFLVSEALRGEGAILRDKSGRAFAKDYHPDGELAPRDIVTRAISAQLILDDAPNVWLDITHLPAETLEPRFPNILRASLQFGVDIRKDYIPVAPAAHYGMGGIKVDAHGQTTIRNLYGVGEVVSSGLHGANRLASNSLLECVVLARRVAARCKNAPSLSTPDPSLLMPPVIQPGSVEALDWLSKTRAYLCELMWQHVGILREGASLVYMQDELQRLSEELHTRGYETIAPLGIELENRLIASRLIVDGALAREESRGGHYRKDFPQTSPHAVHTVLKLPQKALVGV